MSKIIVIGNGIAGMSAAITAAEKGSSVIMIAPSMSERTQSVMAAGGVNACMKDNNENDSVKAHVQDTIKGGNCIADIKAVEGMCSEADSIIRWLESIGMVFSRDKDGHTLTRMMAGHSNKRTKFSGACTGKQIVSALIRQLRRYESEGKVTRRTGQHFLQILKGDSGCVGAVIYDADNNIIYSETSDAVILATGGLNLLLGRTTGSLLCNACAASNIFRQGVTFKNLEMIQYHPTTIDTPQKHMLITEAARGEGGRLFYYDNEKRVYFMEDIYGEKGNLMPRDVVSRQIYMTGRQVYLDISFLGEDIIKHRLQEVYDVCRQFLDLDVTKEAIPVKPCAHYFMGGIAVTREHETSVKNLYAAGECAAIYHGANRLGGNSMLGALYGGRRAGEYAAVCKQTAMPDIDAQLEGCKKRFERTNTKNSRFPSVYVLNEIERILSDNLGIVRNEENLNQGIEDMQFYIEVLKKIRFDGNAEPVLAYSMENMALLAKAILKSALDRRESRGAHYRSDYEELSKNYEKASFCVYSNDNIEVTFAKDESQV